MTQKVPFPRALVNWHVLVVDDEEDSLEVAQMLLEMAGATVLTATNGREALALVKAQRPHFILSDLSMPDVDGWRLVYDLNRNRATADIPVIALTAHAIPGDRERALKAGFVNYITKPLDPDKFIQQLLKLLIEIPELSQLFLAEPPRM
jgi:CheY-like chemotaxis protein